MFGGSIYLKTSMHDISYSCQVKFSIYINYKMYNVVSQCIRDEFGTPFPALGPERKESSKFDWKARGRTVETNIIDSWTNPRRTVAGRYF